eukprot:gene3002-5881_t
MATSQWIWAIATYDFEATDADELGFADGDLLLLAKDDIEKPWGLATSYNLSTGNVPINRLEIMAESSATPESLGFISYHPQLNVTLHTESNDSNTISFLIKSTNNLTSKAILSIKTIDEIQILCAQLNQILATILSPNALNEDSLKVISSIGIANHSTEPGDVQTMLEQVIIRSIIGPIVISWIQSNSTTIDTSPPTDIHNINTNTNTINNINIDTDVVCTTSEERGCDIIIPSATGVPAVGMEYEVLYDWEPQDSDELRLERGDIIVMLDTEGPTGWGYGQSHSSGHEGLFPLNYTPNNMGRLRPFSVSSLEAFDDLLSKGYTCERKPPLPHLPLGVPVLSGVPVSISCKAMTWDGAHTATNPFAETMDDNPLCFIPGSNHVCPRKLLGEGLPNIPRPTSNSGRLTPSRPKTMRLASFQEMDDDENDNDNNEEENNNDGNGSSSNRDNNDRQDITDDMITRAAASMGLTSSSSTSTSTHVIYPYANLMGSPSNLPPGVDAEHRERHLSDDEFLAVMGRNKVDFDKLSEQMQESIRQGRGLL